MTSHGSTLDGPHRAPIEKAVALIKQDRVHLLPQARVFRVQGEHATYDVIVSPAGIFCPCPARIALCSHAISVAMVAQRDGIMPARLIRDVVS